MSAQVSICNNSKRFWQVSRYRHAADKLQKTENVMEKYKKKLQESADLRQRLKVNLFFLFFSFFFYSLPFRKLPRVPEILSTDTDSKFRKSKILTSDSDTDSGNKKIQVQSPWYFLKVQYQSLLVVTRRITISVNVRWIYAFCYSQPS